MAGKPTREYGNESITSLKGADRVRLRPGVIFGSDGLEGCGHSFFEILANSIDEAREGYGKIIRIIRHQDMSITVEDEGRGIPVDFNQKEARFNWELVFCELYAGGKYENNADGNYEFALGLNGLGACATQYSSEWMDVLVNRDGYRHELHFEKGVNIGGLRKTKTAYPHTGSRITWKPDREVFTEIDLPLSHYREVLKRQAVANAGLLFELKDEATGSVDEFCYMNGIVDYVNELGGDKNFTAVRFFEGNAKGRDREDKPEYRVRMQFAFAFNNEVERVEYYHNSSWLEYGGAPDKAVRSAFVYEIDKYLKNTNKYNKNESKITFGDIEDSLILIGNSHSTLTSYENQTKKAVSNRFIQECMTDFLKQQLEIYMIENREEAERIAGQMLVNKRSRESAERARIDVKKKLGGGLDLATRVKKFVDCRTKDVVKRELYIVEGDSALGSCKMGRDSEFQGIMPVRGKILNCLKAEYDQIFKSDIIVDLLKVLGCGVEIRTRHNKDLSAFQLENLRWGKVIICTDADVDGFQIRTLILAMLYRLVPTLIEAGKVFIAESPLFEMTCGNQIRFAYTEKEKADFLKEFSGKKTTMQRSKGLGENEPDMMWTTTMNPASRRLIRVVPDDAEQTREVFDLLLGDNLQGRKDFIAEHGHEYMDMLDVS
jgi:DNA gyrase subunit B